MKEKIALKQFKTLSLEEREARDALVVGMFLYGDCDGLFGTLSLEDKTITHIIGNYLEVKDENGTILSGLVDSWVKLVESSNQEYDKRVHFNMARQ